MYRSSYETPCRTRNSRISSSIQTGGTRDHVHVLFLQSRTLAIAKVVEEVKKISSKWMKGQGVSAFTWQAGYAVFSVSESQKAAVVSYIQRQEAHHRRDGQPRLSRMPTMYPCSCDVRSCGITGSR